jgi:hypothetical protein
VAKVFTCECGMRTTEPFYIGGRLLCTLCAESENPRLVNKRAVANWREFTTTNKKVPTRSHARNWERLND